MHLPINLNLTEVRRVSHAGQCGFTAVGDGGVDGRVGDDVPGIGDNIVASGRSALGRRSLEQDICRW